MKESLPLWLNHALFLEIFCMALVCYAHSAFMKHRIIWGSAVFILQPREKLQFILKMSAFCLETACGVAF